MPEAQRPGIQRGALSDEPDMTLRPKTLLIPQAGRMRCKRSRQSCGIARKEQCLEMILWVFLTYTMVWHYENKRGCLS